MLRVSQDDVGMIQHRVGCATRCNTLSGSLGALASVKTFSQTSPEQCFIASQSAALQRHLIVAALSMLMCCHSTVGHNGCKG